MLALSTALPRKGGEAVTGCRGPEGHGEAGKGDARTGYGASHCYGHLGLDLRGTSCGIREVDLRIATVLIAKAARGELLPLPFPVCCM